MGGVDNKSWEVSEGGKQRRFPDEHRGAEGGRLPRLNQGGGERAVHISGDGVLLLWPIQLDCKDAAFACGQDIHGMWHLDSAINPDSGRNSKAISRCTHGYDESAP